MQGAGQALQAAVEAATSGGVEQADVAADSEVAHLSLQLGCSLWAQASPADRHALLLLALYQPWEGRVLKTGSRALCW